MENCSKVACLHAHKISHRDRETNEALVSSGDFYPFCASECQDIQLENFLLVELEAPLEEAQTPRLWAPPPWNMPLALRKSEKPTREATIRLIDFTTAKVRQRQKHGHKGRLPTGKYRVRSWLQDFSAGQAQQKCCRSSWLSGFCRPSFFHKFVRRPWSPRSARRPTWRRKS